MASRLHKKILLGLALIASSTLTLAAEKMNWAGPYLGVDVGYSWGKDANIELNHDNGLGGPPSGWASRGRLKSGTLGIDAGYNFLLSDKWLTGLGLELRAYNADNKAMLCTHGDCNGDYYVKSSLEDKISIMAKVGYLVDDKSLLYVNGGWADARLKRENIATGIGTENYKIWQHGWSLGFGSEYNFDQNLNAKLEYRYTLYLDEKVDSNLFLAHEKQTLNQNEITAGITYHF